MRLILLLSFLIFSLSTQASLLFEPFAGMSVGSTGELGGTEADLSGSVVGARLGYQNMGFMLGLDARNHSFNADSDSGDSDLTGTTIGGFIGYELPIMFRFYAGMVLSGSFEGESDTEYTEASGSFVGIGYKALPFISLNFEMYNASTAKIKSGSTEIDYDGDYNFYYLTVSIPLNI